MDIHITKEADNGLSMVQYNFYNIRGFEFRLQWYATYDRPTKRHKWKRVGYYSRVESSYNTLKADEVSIPSDIEQEAKDFLLSKLVFTMG